MAHSRPLLLLTLSWFSGSLTKLMKSSLSWLVISVNLINHFCCCLNPFCIKDVIKLWLLVESQSYLQIAFSMMYGAAVLAINCATCHAHFNGPLRMAFTHVKQCQMVICYLYERSYHKVCELLCVCKMFFFNNYY